MREHAMAKVEKMTEKDFFTEYGEANRFTIHEVVGKGSYGVVCSAKNAARPGEKVAIKKITNAFENAIDAKRTLREIKLLRHLKHENVIRITDVSDPPPLETFNDVYVFYELMDTDLHQARSIHWSPYDPVGVVNAVP